MKLISTYELVLLTVIIPLVQTEQQKKRAKKDCTYISLF